MPVRAGLDQLPVQAVSDAVAAHADRYLTRIFTSRELSDCHGDHERLAARFAAKEATLKVLRPDDEGIPWSSIEVQRTSGGWPELLLSGKAAAKAEQEGITSLSVSLTHEAGRAAAVVIAELTPDRGTHPT